MKKAMKIFSVLLVVIMVIALTATVFASDLTPASINGSGATVSTDAISSFGNNIVRILTVVGIVLSVIVLIVLGIKYMMGSAEEKAEYKKTMMPYLIGAALIFAASVVANIVYGFFSNISA